MFDVALNDELRIQEENIRIGYEYDDTYLMELYRAYVDVFVTNARNIDEAITYKAIADDYKEQVKELHRLERQLKG